MGFTIPPLTSAEILAAITSDETKFDGADIDAAISTVEACSYLYFSNQPDQNLQQLNSSATDKTINSITLPNITGVSIESAYAGVKITGTRNTNAGEHNYLSGAQAIQVDTGSAGWIDAIPNMDRYGLVTPASGFQSFGITAIGNADISAKVAFNATTDFQWEDARAYLNNLEVWGIQPVLLVVVK